MESPVRIYLGAVLVVHLLLLCGTPICIAHPIEDAPVTIKNENITRNARPNNTTWVPRSRIKSPEIALNELPRKLSTEEQLDKYVKNGGRGRARFIGQEKIRIENSTGKTRTSTTPTSYLTSTSKLIIVTPTPEVKKPAQIIDSMREYKKTKMPLSSVPSSTAAYQTNKKDDDDDEYEDEDEDELNSLEKFGFSNSHEMSFTTRSESEFLNVQPIKSQDYAKSASRSKNIKMDNFSYESDLTTPKIDSFDKRHREISSSIIKSLSSVRSKTHSRNSSSLKNIDKQSTPKNKTSVVITKSKKTSLRDSESAESTVQELSDVLGTSVYYEMSVLSTENYSVNETNDEDDCDNDSTTLPEKSLPEKQFSVSKTTESPTTILNLPDNNSVASNYFSISTGFPPVISPGSVTVSTQFFGPSTEQSFHSISTGSPIRNRNYSKRLNLARGKDSPNNITPKINSTPTPTQSRQTVKRFHYTTPKTKPVWMAPKRNITRTSRPSATPSTIYIEHFDISDKYISTPLTRPLLKTILTTVSSSDIDPVLQTEISGLKKIVNSQPISDNSIPSLRKRGSAKFGSSTASSPGTEPNVIDMEIPPTLTAWALASLRSPPVISTNHTKTSLKIENENELQDVSDISDNKHENLFIPVVTTTQANEEYTPKVLNEIEQNKLQWRLAKEPLQSSLEKFALSSTEKFAQPSSTEKAESLPAESVISIQSSKNPVFNTDKKKLDITRNKLDTVTESVSSPEITSSIKYVQPIDVTKSTGFESITKLPTGVTTPFDETVYSENVSAVTETNKKISSTTDFEITTIRFTYVPTILTEAEITEINEATTNTWRKIPTRTKPTLTEDTVTTYRPKYQTTTEIEEISTVVPETTSTTEISTSEIVTELKTTTVEAQTNLADTTTELTMSNPTTKIDDPVETYTNIVVDLTTTEILDVITESSTAKINEATKLSTTEKIISSIEPMTESSKIHSSSEENSSSNEVITQESTKTPLTSSTTTELVATLEVMTTKTTSTENIIPTLPQTTTEIERPVTIETGKVSTHGNIIKIPETTTTVLLAETTVEVATDVGTKAVSELEDLSTYNGDVTTEPSSRILTEEAGSGAAVAIAVSTIGVIALILLIGLLLVVRLRNRRGVYAQRCTPVSLDAYSLDNVSVGQRKGNQRNHRIRASKRSYGNPAYDDEVTSHPMQYTALANFSLDVESITAEFAEIPSASVKPEEVPPGCEDKNRYANVLPLPETRVPLIRIGSDPSSEYINANFITGPGNIRNYYVACQAPLHNTVIDFWRMVWEQNSRVVVMLTEFLENGVEKCYEYLPPSEVSDNKRVFGQYQVILKKREQQDKYAISCLQVINLSTRTWREVTHLWYFWPAKGLPDDYDSVIDFLSEIRSYMKLSQNAKEYDEEGMEVIYGEQHSSLNNLSKLRSDDNSSTNGMNVYSPSKAEEQMRRGNNGTLGRMKAASEIEGVRPCVVMCASGAGRSACLIALDICARAIAAGVVDVPRVVREIRAQRPHSLTNKHHYVLIYKVLSEYGNKLMGGGVDTI